MRKHEHSISIEAIRLNLVEKTDGAPYTTEMILAWIERNKTAMGYDYVGADMMLTYNQSLRVSVGLPLDMNYDEVGQYFKKVGIIENEGEEVVENSSRSV